MRAEPFTFREFTGEAIGGAKAAAKGFISSGSKKPAAVEEPAAPPPPPTFNEEELKKAEGEAYRKGFLDGTKEGQVQAESVQADVDRHLSQITEEFVQHIAPLFRDYSELATQVRQDMPRIALAIAQKVAGAALAQDAKAVVEDMAMRCCETMIGQPALNVTVHASLADTLDGKLKAMAERHQHAAKITVSANVDIPMTDCKIEWKHGAMERRTELLWKQVEDVVGDIIASGVRDGGKQAAALKAELPKAPPLAAKQQVTEAAQAEILTPTEITSEKE